MIKYQIVIDTNVLVTALRSKQGASYKLLSLIDSNKFEINISVPLVVEYEDVTKRFLDQIQLTVQDIDDLLDYICKVANHHKIYYLWRPFLNDIKDDMLLELAVTAECDFIISFNKKDFVGIEHFGLSILTPQEFLQKVEVI